MMLEERINSEVSDLPLDQLNLWTEQLIRSHVLDPEEPSDIFFWSDLRVENTVRFNVDNCEMLS